MFAAMPPRWPRQPDRRDPAYRRLADRMNFAVHVAVFAATNSGAWFFRTLEEAAWPWTLWLTTGWAIVLFSHGLYIFAVANYEDKTAAASSTSDQSP
jgi:hypothetical protein